MAKSDNVKTHDWIGARVVHPSAPPDNALGGGGDAGDLLTFFVWKCSADRRLYLITGAETLPDNAPICPKGHWHFVKSVREEGRHRVGFSEADAKRDIMKDGFHAVRLDIPTSIRADDDADDA
mgnify:CR=1 FL=1